MLLTRIIRPALLGTALFALGTVAGGVAVSGQIPTLDGDLVHGVPGTANKPINTAKQYRWGNASWKDEFVGGYGPGWIMSDPAPTIQTQYGQLTLNGPGGTSAKTLSAEMPINDQSVGRWDFSMRSKQYQTTGSPYTIVLELIPNAPAGDTRTVIATFPIGADKVTAQIRNQGRSYTQTVPHEVFSNQFHTYALEVTPTRISWFMEGKVLMTETRTGALSGKQMRIRVRLVPAGDGARTNKGRVQFDWMRYYTLARKNAKSTDAPAGIYTPAGTASEPTETPSSSASPCT